MSIRIFALVSLLAACSLPSAAENYTQVATWGETGSGPGQLREPIGIDVDKEGFVYIADSRNQRIQKFDSKGRIVMQIGEPGEGPGQFQKPIDVAVAPNGTIYVSDYALDRVKAF